METKPVLSADARDAIRDLIQINSDSYRGFETAADAIENPAYEALFRRIANERRRHRDELARLVETDGEKAGSFKGKLHRWWLELRAGVQGGDEHAVLAEAERGEDEIKARYESVLGSYDAAAIQKTLRAHQAEINRHHDQIKVLRDASKK